MPDAPDIVVSHLPPSARAGTEERLSAQAFIVGRDRSCALRFEEDLTMVSARHAMLTARDGQLWLRDLDSQNGTWINGERMSGPVLVMPRDIVQLGRSGPAFRVQLATAGQPKKLVGQETLQRAIATAAASERDKVNRRLQRVMLGIASLAVVTAGVWWLVWSNQEVLGRELEETRLEAAALREQIENDIDQRLRDYDRQLETLRGGIGEGAALIARLQVEIQERDKAIDELRERRDLSDKQRERLREQAEKRLEEVVDQFDAKVAELRARSDHQAWARLATRYESGVFLLVGLTELDGGMYRHVLGTGFAIREDGVLATNAHVVRDLEGSEIRSAVQNGTGIVFPIVEIAKHPDHDGPRSPDVGLVRLGLEDRDLVALELAGEEELRRLTIGTHLGTLGYPGELADHYLKRFETGVARTAAATFKDGWIGRITDYEMAVAPFEGARFIQHSASMSGGTSGSPMFTADGKVVAINNAVIEVALAAAGGERTPSAAELASAIRIDVLTEFLEDSGW